MGHAKLLLMGGLILLLGVLVYFLSPSLLQHFYKDQRTISSTYSTEDEEVIAETKEVTTPSDTPKEKLPWENSTCGNNICESCEGSDSCCNYPPTKDKNGQMVYPPPTCLGKCTKDCDANTDKNNYSTGPFILNDPDARYYIENNILRYESKSDPKHPIGVYISKNTTIAYKQFEGKDVIVTGTFELQNEDVQCIHAPCPAQDITVLQLKSIRLK